MPNRAAYPEQPSFSARQNCVPYHATTYDSPFNQGLSTFKATSPVIPSANISTPKTHWTRSFVRVMVRPRQRPFSLPVAGAKNLPPNSPGSSMRFAVANSASDSSLFGGLPGRRGLGRCRTSRSGSIGLQGSVSDKRSRPMRSRLPRRQAEGDLSWFPCSPRPSTGLGSGTARGFACARRQLALLLRLRRPAGYGFPRNLVRKPPRKDFSGPSVNAELRHLGAWPTRSRVPRPKAGQIPIGEQRYVPEQSHPHRFRRQRS